MLYHPTAVLCYAMLYYAMLCYAMRCYAFKFAMLFYAMLGCVKRCSAHGPNLTVELGTAEAKSGLLALPHYATLERRLISRALMTHES